MELEAMANIGSEMAGKLRAAGIHSAEELTAAGAEEAFLRLKSIPRSVWSTSMPWRGPLRMWRSTAWTERGSGS